VGQCGGGHDASGFSGILGPFRNGGQTVRWILAGGAVIKVYCRTYSEVNDVGFDAAQISGGSAGGVGYLSVGAVRL